ncbi:MAG: pyridoxamine 5'-phosphate oxidase family protein [Chloroflexi bacterium]|nr:pyridoxamine 5'-phosphate oxidase family protein [Chloroflexota bacterium]
MPMIDHITDEQADLIRNAKVFFVASADPSFGAGPNGEGPVNLSPKGAADLQVIDRHTIAYFDYRGSGNETARHTAAGGPITVMVTSFDEDAAIVRLYGRAVAKPLEESVLAEQAEALRAVEMPTPERQVIEISVDCTQTSCGYGVPLYEYRGDRSQDERGRRYK